MEPVQFSTNQSLHTSLNAHPLSEAEFGKAVMLCREVFTARHRNIPGSIQDECYQQHFSILSITTSIISTRF